ncbi:MAG: hypothetical protein ABIO91_02790 [Pyrinomonadaceae bacterium]
MNTGTIKSASFANSRMGMAFKGSVILILSFILMGLTQETVEAQVTYTFANQSKYVIRELYVSSVKDPNWSSDWLGSKVLLPKQTFVSNEIEKGLYDVKIVVENNAACVSNNVLVDKNSIVTITDLYLIVCDGSVFKKLPPPTGNQPSKPKIKVSGSPPKSPDIVLLNNGCNRIAGTVGGYDCSTAAGYSICLSYKDNGKLQTCNTSLDWAAVGKISDDLFTLGCKRFLGRPDEFLCVTKRGFDACEVYREHRKVKKCRMAGE